MPVNSTHPEYDANAPDWSRARDVLAGEDAVKAAGEKYLPRIDSQTDTEFAAYKTRAAFFNATGRTAEGYVGLMFRRPPFVKAPGNGNTTPNSLPSAERVTRRTASGVAGAFAEFINDADMLGTTLAGYAKNVVWEVMGIGRAGSLVDWESEVDQRAYVSLYSAEQIINWRVEHVNGRSVPTLIVLQETANVQPSTSNSQHRTERPGDEFELKTVEQIRVLRLVPGDGGPDGSGVQEWHCEVELWVLADGHQAVSHYTVGQNVNGQWPATDASAKRPYQKRGAKKEWRLVERRIPLRLGKPLPLIPFVFHGPRHSQPQVDRPPLSDIIAVNLDHYRMDADYKHGLHFTALPTAWVSGFPKETSLRIGSSVVWFSDTPGATAGFLEFTGQGLMTFERAMDRDERLMAVLGSRLLEDQKKVGETAQAIELRQSGEHSVLSSVATSVSESLTQVLRWVYWWNSTEETPEAVTDGEVLIQVNTDFSTKGMDSLELQAVVAAWQSGAISRDTMFELFRKGEILPDGRTNEDEARLVEVESLRTANTPEIRNPNAVSGGHAVAAKAEPAAVSAGKQSTM